MNWYHAFKKGQYNVVGKEIALDWSRLFLHPEEAQMTMAHEMFHAILADFDFGQATQNFFQVAGKMPHISEENAHKMMSVLHRVQEYVQEGCATLEQIRSFSDDVGKSRALKWADENLHPEYLTRFNTLRFVFNLSEKYQSLWMDLSARLPLETGIRKNASRLHIFESSEALKDYLSHPNHNPDERLKRVVEVIRYRPHLLLRSREEIAAEAGIAIFGPPSKDEVADFLNYTSRLAKLPKIFTAADIGDTPSVDTGYVHFVEDMTIGNLNLNFTGNSEYLRKEEDILHYADVIEAVILLPAGKDVKDTYLENSQVPPDIVLAMFRATGEKYTAALSTKRTSDILANEMSETTILIKNGGFDVVKNQMVASPDLRHADVVIYNNIKSLTGAVDTVLKHSPQISFKKFHAGATHNHPFQILILKFGEQHPLHIVVTYGGTGISTLLEKIAQQTISLTAAEITERERVINNLMAVWMNMLWQVNWVKSMLDRENLYFRKGKVK